MLTVYSLYILQMSELLSWLEDIDVEEYEEKFNDIGVKKLKHLKDVEKKHLLAMGMKELEVTRFLKKQQSAFEELNSEPSTSASINAKERPKVQVAMPTTVFGHNIQAMDAASLAQEYSVLWYETPMNLKHKASNDFVLGMCAAARPRFSDKHQTIQWARSERQSRVLTLLSLAAPEDMSEETAHFQKENILCELDVVIRDHQVGL